MLSGKKIVEEVEKGNIVIKPFYKEKVGANSYNLRLGSELTVYTGAILDCKKQNKTRVIKITDDGYILEPGILYLAKTVEYTENPKYVPQLSGRSSIGRVGISVHITAGFGAVGFKGAWTLGLTCVRPVRVYPGMEICQIYFFELYGDSSIKYGGKYSNDGKVLAGKMYLDFEEDNK